MAKAEDSEASSTARMQEPGRAEASRARLLEAAVTAFSEQGFHATTTRDLAAASGLSQAALYVHHKSKHELLYLVSLAGHEETLDAIAQGLATSAEPIEQLRQVVYNLCWHHARRHMRARIVNNELTALAPEHLAEIEPIRRRIYADVHGIVERGVRAGAFQTPDPRLATYAVLSLGIDIPRWYRDGGRWTPEAIGTMYSEMALRMLGATD